MSDAYTRMCTALDAMHDNMLNPAFVESLTLAQVARIALNTELESRVCALRLRAEHAYAVLLRDAAGLPPKNKRDAAWLAQFDQVQP
jgi:hypothetical protein